MDAASIKATDNGGVRMPATAGTRRTDARQANCPWRVRFLESQRTQLHNDDCGGCPEQFHCAARERRLSYLESARALTAAVEAKDPCTRQHSLTVSRYAVELGKEMQLEPPRLEALRIAALLHDIGKIGVPDAILQKPGTLTADEQVLVKLHPRVATDILRHTSFFDDELPIILHHHERYDGAGYPSGLAGREIPREARILNVADSVDAMLSQRAYKASHSITWVRAELDRCAGRQFDPEVVEVATHWLDRTASRQKEFAASG